MSNRFKRHKMYLVLGAIASGKSQVSKQILQESSEIEYLCADSYKTTFFNYQAPSDNSIKAYRCADELLFYRVDKLCHDGVDFILEFCPTNRNKFDTIKYYSQMYKYDIISYFVGTDDVEINLERAHQRIEQGGDQISDDKISSRYQSAFNSILEIVNISKSTCFIDNSGETLKMIAIQKKNRFHILMNNCEWFNKRVKRKILNQKG